MAKRAKRDANMRISYVRLDEVVPAERNPKGHDASIGSSIGRFGFNDPLVMDERTGRLVEGHGRLEELLARHDRGDDPPARVDVDDDGTWLVPVVRGVRFGDDGEAAAYLLAHNQTTSAGGWTDDLDAMLAELDADGVDLDGLGWDEDLIASVLEPDPPQGIDPGPTAPPADSVVGEVYELGPHRTLQWVKDRFVLGRADYHHRHEPVFYGWVPGAAHYFIDDRTQDTIFEVDRPATSPDHPTAKPVELIRRMLANSTKRGWVVGDPFAGSGSTMIACAELGLHARLIELDPKYCDVIRKRWTTYAISAGVDPGPGALHG